MTLNHHSNTKSNQAAVNKTAPKNSPKRYLIDEMYSTKLLNSIITDSKPTEQEQQDNLELFKSMVEKCIESLSITIQTKILRIKAKSDLDFIVRESEEKFQQSITQLKNEFLQEFVKLKHNLITKYSKKIESVFRIHKSEIYDADRTLNGKLLKEKIKQIEKQEANR